MKTRILFHPLEIQDLTQIGANAGAQVVDIVLRGDTPHAVIVEPFIETFDEPPTPADMEVITLRMLTPGDTINANETYVGSFFARRFVVVVKVA